MTKRTLPVLMGALGMLLPVWRTREIGCPGSKHPEFAAYDREIDTGFRRDAKVFRGAALLLNGG